MVGDVMIRLYHYTFKDNVESILENGLLESIHKEKNWQWLGNGIYFFDEAVNVDFVKNMLKSKGNIGDLVRIEKTLVHADIEEHMFDLRDKDDQSYIIEYFEYGIKNQFFGLSETDLILMNVIFEHLDNARPFNNKYFGISLGNFMNKFVKDCTLEIWCIVCAFATKKSIDTHVQYCCKPDKDGIFMINPIETEEIKYLNSSG